MPRAVRKKPIHLVAGPPRLICDALCIRDDDLRPAINSGEVPVYKLGLRRRIVVEDVIRWLRTHPQANEVKHA